MSKRKILIIVENLPVPFDTRVWQEATTLVKNGYTVSVVCPTGKGFEAVKEVLEGVHVYRYDHPKEGNGVFSYYQEYLWALKEQLRLARKVFKEVGFDVIQGCNPPDNIFMISWFFKRYGVDYIFDHHDICPELFYAKFGYYGFLYRAQLFMERRTYKRATMAFVTNRSYRKIAIERGGMSPKNIFVLRSGPKLERMKIQPPKPEIKRGKKYMVGYVGVIGQQEGIDYLLEAAAYLKEKGRKDIFYGICGGGPYLEEAKAKAKTMGLDDCVEFTGRISDELLLDYLNTADICVNPDEYNDMNDKSTMNKILEYMALGKAIVQFDLTEGKYSAREASLYAKRNDSQDMAAKIVELLDDEALRQKMGDFGRKRVVNELSWDHTSKALLEGYDYYFTKLRTKPLVAVENEN